MERSRGNQQKVVSNKKPPKTGGRCKGFAIDGFFRVQVSSPVPCALIGLNQDGGT